MQRFYCQCGTEIFFENSHCSVCGKILGFDPEQQYLFFLQPDAYDSWFTATTGNKYRQCQLRQELGCNWLVPMQDSHKQCLSCRSTRTIPSLTYSRNLLHWQRLEQTKRRALYMVQRLGLPLAGNPQNNSHFNEESLSNIPPLIFDFLEDQRSNPNVPNEFVYSGHSEGIVTINSAEADDSFRTANRELMNELYRTLLGHFRHELGHYFGMLLKGDALTEFRQLFGDEREDYQAALARYYAEGASNDWRTTYISAYASSHPLEDWAETWAHYLHISDTLETAKAYGVIEMDGGNDSFINQLSGWAKLSVTLNALNRSMGVDDAYPFVITPMIQQKLEFIDRRVKAWRGYGHNGAGQ